METTNLSKIRREKMLKTISEIKKSIYDESTLNNLSLIESELNSKKYGLIWEEHEERVDVELGSQIPVFVESKMQEIKLSNNDKYNFLLEGDNLHSLYLLEKTHKNKIDVIYIDPPYNTGKDDFRYDDKMIGEDDLFRHSKWISFISKRLEQSKKLLKDDGIIFISIDDNEQATMRLICDDIFGENNRVATFVWKKRYQGAKEKHIVVVQEYILMYCKNKDLLPTLFVSSDEEYAKKYFKNSDEWGSYRTQPLEAGKSMDDRPNLRFPIMAPDGTEVYPKRQWIWGKEHVDEGIKKHVIGFSKAKNGSWNVFIKQYLHNEDGEQRKTKMFSIIDGIYTQHGTKEIENIFGDGNVFKFPKPSKLIKRLLELTNYKHDPLILDFFAGSGTTAHAVLEMNNEDNGKRQFILCTNNENNICEDITYQRIKTVITGKRLDGSNYSSGIKSNLKYYKTAYVPRINTDEENLSKNLMVNIKNLIQLENGIEIDDKIVRVILTEEDIDIFTTNEKELNECEKLYISSDILLTSKQSKIFKDYNIELFIIPEYYFEDEIREVA